MRTLIYIPIIHMSADLGTVATEVDRKGIAFYGPERWEDHKETINQYWEKIATYFKQIEPKGFKIYQDGLVADGEMGVKIVADGVQRGSKNYEIIEYLLNKGAQLIQTEDIHIVMKEYKFIKQLAKAKFLLTKIFINLKYIILKNKILKERDIFIANRINETLKKEEKGILFMGAYHNILDKLSKDIEIVELKDRNKVLKYMRRFYLRAKNEELEKSATYLKESIEAYICADIPHKNKQKKFSPRYRLTTYSKKSMFNPLNLIK